MSVFFTKLGVLMFKKGAQKWRKYYFCEKLLEDHSIRIDHETVRQY